MPESVADAAGRHSMFRQPIKLLDCDRHGAGSGAELFIVEGDSAAGSVALVRDPATQAVLPLMGKPLNAVKAPLKKVEAYPLFASIVDAIGAGQGAGFELARARYERVILLMDADADGIHCAALMILYFHRMMPQLLNQARIAIAHAPMASLVSATLGSAVHVFSEVEYRAAARELRERGVNDVKAIRYRGLAGLDRYTLAATCLDPATRVLRPVGSGDAQAALKVFGGHDPDVYVSMQRRFEF